MTLIDFSQVNVLVVGDIILDHYLQVDVERISPEAPVPICKVKDQEYRLGGAANVAANCKSLGANVCLLGLVGDNNESAIIERLLSDIDIEAPLLSVPGYHPPTKSRIVGQRQQMMRVDYESDEVQYNSIDFLGRYDECLRWSDVVIISDYRKGLFDDCTDFISLAELYNKHVFVDPKSNELSDYFGAYVLTPNRNEMENLMRVDICDENVDILHKKMKNNHISHIVNTCGSRGVNVISQSDDHYHMAVEERQVYDVTGAGDTFIATLTLAHTSGLEFSTAIEMANTAASLQVSRLGTDVIFIEELRSELANKDQSINYQEAALDKIKALQLSGHKIVMTNGCFDMLHVGHVKYLEEARRLGDYLIVAVNSDDSVRAIKGENRPINELSERMMLLQSLQSVDVVIAFDELTPETVIKMINPDVLVKGGDYSIDEVVGGDYVKTYGGEVLSLTYYNDFSTTKLLEDIAINYSNKI